MRVAFNARLLADPSLRGWNRYTINLLAALPACGIDLVLLTDRGLHDEYLARLPAGSFQVRTAPRMRYAVWEQHWLPGQCAHDRVDVLHCPFNFGLPWSSPCPCVLTLHDAIDRAFERAEDRWRDCLRPAHGISRLYLWQSRRRAHHIITGSQHARRDIVHHFGLQPDRITVIHHAADPRFHAPVLAETRSRVREAHLLTRPYVFYVGGWDERKNLPLLVRAFAAAGLADVELVLGGGREDERPAIETLTRELGISGRVRLQGYVPDSDLPALYAEALCFVYPSRYEGFGLQLCEAMAVGCPTLAADATSLPEVLGDGGLRFRLDDAAELSAHLRRVAGDTAFRDQLARRAVNRATQFSWHRTAEQTAAVYRAALERA